MNANAIAFYAIFVPLLLGGLGFLAYLVKVTIGDAREYRSRYTKR